MVDKQEQYSQCNGILINELEEKKNKTTDGLIFEKNNNELEIDLQVKDIDPTHRIGNYRKDNGGKTQAVIIEFIRYLDRRKVFNNKKRLKRKTYMTESLTKERRKEVQEARDWYSFKKVWTNDGKVTFKKNDND